MVSRLSIAIISWCCVVVCIPTNTFVCAQQSGGNQTPYDDWLVIEDGKVNFKIRADVFLPDGQPADGISVIPIFSAKPHANTNIEISGNRVTATLPVLEYAAVPVLSIRTTDGSFGKKFQISSAELRHLGKHGTRVTLDPLHQISITVIDENGAPVPKATFFPDRGVETDANGVATVSHYPEQGDRQINVVTPDGKVGILDLKKSRMEQPNQNEFKVSVQPGVQQVLQFVSGNGEPVPGIAAYPQPMDRSVHLFAFGGFPMRTDKNGQVNIVWLPKPPGTNAFVSVMDDNWTTVSEERTAATWTVKLKKLARTKVVGQVELPDGVSGGFNVRLTSFDYPTANRVDQLYAIADEHGNFEFDAMPGAVYCAYVVDLEWSSSFWDGVPAELDGTTHEPHLTLTSGVPVRVVCLQGPGKSPMVNADVSIGREHQFRTRDGNGVAAARWYVTTDENGIAVAMVAPGKMKASIYSEQYNDSKELIVQADGKNEIVFHRKSAGAQSVTGKLVGSQAAIDSSAGADIYLETTDGKIRFSDTGKTDDGGRFDLQAIGERFAVFAITADKQFAGHIFCDMEQAKSIQIPLLPTATFQGRLLNAAQIPVSNCNVIMEMRLTDPIASDQSFFRSSKLITRFSTKTDEDGNFEFENAPANVPLVLRIDDLQFKDPGQSYIGKRMLEVDDARPRETITIRNNAAAAAAPRLSLEERLSQIQLDCRINHIHQLVILLGSGERTESLARNSILDYDDNRDVLSYLPIMISQKTARRPEIQKLFAARQFPTPDNGQLAMIAFAADGSRLGELMLQADEPDATEAVKTFLKEHKGEPADARRKLDDALDVAKESDRKVWALTGGTRCGPCFRLARWIDSQREILEKHFVFVKVNGFLDENGAEIAKRICSGKRQGIPFFCIFDADGIVLVDSEGPLGNTGHPSSYEGRTHLRKLLSQTSSLTEPELDALIKSLEQ